MFCAKCGAQITANDQFCPRCGAKNDNYIATDISSGKSDQTNPPIKLNNNITRIVPILAIVCIILVLIVLVSRFLTNHDSPSLLVDNGKVSYSPYGLTGYLGNDGTMSFVDSGNIISFEGEAEKGRSSPDHSNYVVIYKGGVLKAHNPNEGTEDKICDNASTISAVNNDGCFYTTGISNHLYYYSFKNKNNIDVGMQSCKYRYSSNKATVIGIDDDGLVKLFSIKAGATNVLCTIDKEADICCIADDGSNIVWTTNTGNTFDVYMVKNGAPERIGKITNADKYAYVSGIYYDDSKSFIVYSSGSSQIIRSKRGKIQEIVLPGVKTTDSFLNENGDYIDSDDDCIKEPYLTVAKTSSSDVASLYRLQEDGSVTLELEGIRRDPKYKYIDSYACIIRDGVAYYLDEEGDLYVHKLGEVGDSREITTDVSEVQISRNGKYAYIKKASSLYYINLKNKDYKLNLIASKIGEDDYVYITDRDDVIFYISDSKSFSDSYKASGNLNVFHVGESSKFIVDKIMSLNRNDQKQISAEYPVFEQYESRNGYNYKINVGTYIDGTYKELIHNVDEY